MKYNNIEDRKSNQTFKESKTRKTFLRVLLYILPLCLLGMNSCKSPESITKRLFMQSKRANLQLPDNTIGSSQHAMLKEEVNYIHQDNNSLTLQEQDSIQKVRKSISEMQYLNEVMVTARVKQKFAPERDGKVNVDFVVYVPKELLSSDWRVSLQPKLLHNDSVVELKQVIFKGENFLLKQQQDSIDFVNYKNSIISTSSYDSLFLNRKGINEDLYKQQRHYFDLYNKELKKVMAYHEWKNNTLDRYARFNSKAEGNRLNLYHSYKRKQQQESIRLLITGADTTGISRKYENKYNRIIRLLPQYHLNRELTERKVPGKYKNFFFKEPKLEEIINHSTTDKDSIQIAEHHYFFDRIAENELKTKHLDKVKVRMITFPKEQYVLLDSIVNTAKDAIFYYRQEYPVTPGLNRLRITMNGQITAIDRSGYTLPKSDTLHYLISSLSQLADTSLIIRKTKLYRNMFDRMTIYPKFESNKAGFTISYQDNKQRADSLISHYRKLTEGMGLQMDSMQVVSWSSLDGNYETNYKLSQQRAESLSEYLQSSYPGMIGYNTIKVIPKGEDWQGFVNELNRRDDILNKDSILARAGRAVYPDQTEQELRRLYKKDYKTIREEVYPRLMRMDVTFHLSRPGMVATDSIQEEIKEGYQEGLRLLQNKEYYKALKILKDYPDYNAALCLVCMGYNGKAYDLLIKLPESANNEYLMAIVTQRMDKDKEAIGHLLKAIELDPQKAYRINQDSEVTTLVNRYNLQGRINSIQDSPDLP